MRIAIIDDTQSSLDLMAMLVRVLGPEEVHLFLSPVEGLSWCTKNKFDLLIVDYVMPELDGLTLLSQLRAQGSDVPIILVTGEEDGAIGKEALERGANEFVAKPVKRYEFLGSVAKQLATRTGR